jgi:hypothetical protein
MNPLKAHHQITQDAQVESLISEEVMMKMMTMSQVEVKESNVTHTRID